MTTPLLPPGSTGLPLLGETLTFAANPFRFVDERVAKHGKIFRTHILGQHAAIITGPDAGGAFLDDANCTRVKSQPPHIAKLFMGESLPALDGAAHKARKQIVMEAFTPQALADYLPTMQRLIDRYLERWSASGGTPLRWSEELERLAMHVVAANFLGLEDDAALDTMRDDYRAITSAFAAIPINVPGTKLNRAVKAVRRVRTRLMEIVRAERQQPTGTGLARILNAKAEDGSVIGDEAAAFEAHHLIIAGYIVFAEFANGIAQLTKLPALRESLTAAAKSRPATLSLDALFSDRELGYFVMEVKRTTTVLPFVLGRARREFVFAGYRIPKDWLLLWAITASHRDSTVYTDPATFDPARFAPGRAEHLKHPHGFAPQGVGGPMSHRCAGLDYATMFMATFFSQLLARVNWTLPQQNLDLDTTTTPPLFADRLLAVVSPAGGA